MSTPCLSRPKEPSLFSPVVALLLQDSWRFPQNPTLPSLASPTSNIGRVEKACSFGSVAKLYGDHESVQRRPCNKYGNINDWAQSHYLWAQSQKTDQHHWAPKPFTFYKSSWTAFFAGDHPCYFQRRFCRWCHPVDEKHGTVSAPPAPTGSKQHLIL